MQRECANHVRSLILDETLDDDKLIGAYIDVCFTGTPG